MKVQCSEATYQLLKKLGNFHLECRGSIEIKVHAHMHACTHARMHSSTVSSVCCMYVQWVSGRK